MPLPSRKKNEDKSDFLSRCMSDETMNKEYDNNSQRYAICLNRSKGSLLQQVCDNISESDDSIGYTEEINDFASIVVPEDTEYLDFGENPEEYIFSKYKYKDPRTGQIYYFDMRKNHMMNGRNLVYVGKAAEYQGKKVTLNKPFRTPKGPKKFSVYVKNEKGNVVKVNFGDPNMKIKKNIPERRKSFRARHNCDSPGPKWKARYWSCKAW